MVLRRYGQLHNPHHTKHRKPLRLDDERDGHSVQRIPLTDTDTIPNSLSRWSS